MNLTGLIYAGIALALVAVVFGGTAWTFGSFLAWLLGGIR